MDKATGTKATGGRTSALLKQMFRYGIVGLSGFMLEYAVFNLTVALSPETASIFSLQIAAISIAHTCGLLLGAVWTFLLNKFWSFRARSNTAVQSAKYAGLLLFNLVATNIMLVFAADTLGIAPNIAKLFIMAVVAAWNFFISKYFIYKNGG